MFKIKFRNLLLLILTICISFSCTDHKAERTEKVSEITEQFSQNQGEWDNLNQRILKDSFILANKNRYLYSSSLNNTFAKELEDKGVSIISVDTSNNCTRVKYSSNWFDNTKGFLRLTWSTCDSIQPENIYYEDVFNDIFVEYWQIDDNWMILTSNEYNEYNEYNGAIPLIIFLASIFIFLIWLLHYKL